MARIAVAPRPQKDEVAAPDIRPDYRLRYGGEWFSAASALLSSVGCGRPRRMAGFVAKSVGRPRRTAALIALMLRTRSEYVFLSGSATGEALRRYLTQRRLAVVPGNRLCQGVLILPPHHDEYLRGHRRQALRTNLRRAKTAGIRCEIVDDPAIAVAMALEVLTRRSLDREAESLRVGLVRPELTHMVACDKHGHPLAFLAAVIDDAVCLVDTAVASDHRARWALHDYLVRILISRGVRYVLATGGGALGALGFEPNVQHYQHLLGYELRHVLPARTRRPKLTARLVAALVAIAVTASLVAPPVAASLV